MTWHVDAALLGAYAAGTTDGVVSTSIEQHVLRCATCRAELGACSRGRRGPGRGLGPGP